MRRMAHLADWRMADPVDQSLVITLPKKGNLQQRQNYEQSASSVTRQSRDENHTEQIDATSGKDHR